MIDFNIKSEDVMAQYERETQPRERKSSSFDPKNYLNARLGANETSKTIVIRLLPFSSEEPVPFHKIHVHQVKVKKEGEASEWKMFVCPTKNHLGKTCPFCDLAAEYRELKNKATSEIDKKNYSDGEMMNRARDMWIARVIQRGAEDDGVKFWLFPSRKTDGIYDKIMNLYTQRRNNALAKGSDYNIFDLNSGKDLFLTITKKDNNKTEYQITDDDEKTPLSTSDEQAIKWIEDDKKWTSVYTVKPVEYMEIIINGGVPYYDKESGKYIDKKEFDAMQEEARAEKVVETYTAPQEDLSKITNESKSVDDIVVDGNTAYKEEPSYDDLPF